MIAIVEVQSTHAIQYETHRWRTEWVFFLALKVCTCLMTYAAK